MGLLAGAAERVLDQASRYYDYGKGWRGTWEFDGGAFMNQASHYVDLVDWLVGPVERVQAMMSTTKNRS